MLAREGPRPQPSNNSTKSHRTEKSTCKKTTPPRTNKENHAVVCCTRPGRQHLATSGRRKQIHEPAPHPTKASTAMWKRVLEDKGPIGLMIQVIYAAGANIDLKFQIWAKNEVPVHIMETPYQHLAKLVLDIAARARTQAACDTKSTNENIKEIDKEVTMKAVETMTKEDKAMLRTTQCGG